MADPIYVPSLGATGLWTLNAPYNSLVLATTQYSCIAVTTVAGAVASGQDPLNTIYLANGDVKATFEQDLANGDYLVTITSGPGDLVTFPRSAMVGQPIADGVLYRNVFLGVSLSVIPDDLDLSSLQQQVSDLVLHNLGVKSSVYLAAVGGTTILSPTQAAALEAARQARIQSPESVTYQNLQLQTQLAAAQARINALSAYIAQHVALVS